MLLTFFTHANQARFCKVGAGGGAARRNYGHISTLTSALTWCAFVSSFCVVFFRDFCIRHLRYGGIIPEQIKTLYAAGLGRSDVRVCLLHMVLVGVRLVVEHVWHHQKVFVTGFLNRNCLTSKWNRSKHDEEINYSIIRGRRARRMPVLCAVAASRTAARGADRAIRGAARRGAAGIAAEKWRGRPRARGRGRPGAAGGRRGRHAGQPNSLAGFSSYVRNVSRTYSISSSVPEILPASARLIARHSTSIVSISGACGSKYSRIISRRGIPGTFRPSPTCGTMRCPRTTAS